LIPVELRFDRADAGMLVVRHRSPKGYSASWDPVARWYSGWVGIDGSRHHRELAIPALMELLNPRPGELVLDLGCGPGVLSPEIASRRASLTGIDLSPRLIAVAQRNHGSIARFLIGDATRLVSMPTLSPESFDAATFLLSLQDISPLHDALRGVAWVLRPGGRVVIAMTHPCFRVPRQSGWGFDEKRSLQFRRIDRYLSQLSVPMQQYPAGLSGTTISYHRPLEEYVNELAACGLAIDAMREIAGGSLEAGAAPPRWRSAACREIPLFMVLRAHKTGRGTR
jgi:ubiquinone/menaquinone biosynthesis C-methylase UbiE